MYFCNISTNCLSSNDIFEQTIDDFGKKYAVYN